MCQTPALTTLTAFQEQLKGAVHADAIAREAPIKASCEMQATVITELHAFLLLNPYPADVRLTPNIQIKRAGDCRLGELNLQAESLQQHHPRRLITWVASGENNTQNQDTEQGQTPLNPGLARPLQTGQARQVRQHGRIRNNPMIGWLQGERIDTWSQGGRQGLVIACGGVGYEVQFTSGQRTRLDAESQCTVWVHQVQREDGSSLYGFLHQQERDLFRTLISVNGVGPQMALALLECCGAEALVEAIVEGDLRQLTQAQGVGKRTAERLAVELRDRLSSWRSPSDGSLSLVDRSDLKTLPIQGDSLQELQQTLEALGYEDLEIRRAMRAVAGSEAAPESSDSEAWLRESLRWLSRASA